MYLWLDLETTGLEPALDDILEIGVTITGTDLQPIFSGEWLTPPKRRDWRTNADPFVLEMHDNSGLADELSPQWSFHHHRLAEVEALIVNKITPYLTDGKITLAGSGVGTFDLQVIKERMPELAARLTYHVMDVGVIRRFLTDICGRPLSDLGPVRHRALDDVEHHLEEARYYVGYMSPPTWMAS